LAKLKFGIVVGLLALWTLPGFAQDTTTNTVSFNGFSFTFGDDLATNVNISQFAGDATDLQQPGGPEAPHTEFVLYNERPAPESFLDGVGGIRVYNSADFAGYTEQTARATNLQTLTAAQSDLSAFMTVSDTPNELPFLPVFGASQVIRARAQYVQNEAVSGVSYITVYRQDVSPFLADEFLYTFQGFSADGLYYVSVVFPISATVFPTELGADFDMAAFEAGFNDYLTESVNQLNNALPEEFSPSLATLDTVISSFSFVTMGGVAPGDVAMATATTAGPTAVQTAAPGSMQGLASIPWTLVSYGDPAAPTPVLTTAPVTILFNEQGVSGSAGCNTYGGFFEFNVNNLVLTNLVSTMIACEDQNAMTQESAYLAALNTVTSFETTGDQQLRLFYPGGVMNFVNANALTQTSTAAAPTVTTTATATP
jgi:heat shock protein HslJ